jgi:hypothetical protein
MRWLVRRLHAEGGVTVVELGFAMLLTSIVSALMIVWIIGVAGADDRSRSNDAALGDLRDVSDQMSRDVRSAEFLLTAEHHVLSLWLDGDRDDVLDTGEQITWTVGSMGTVTRSTDAGTGVTLASRMDAVQTGFAYDATAPADVARVTILLVATSPSGDGHDELRLATDVYLRNP